ncbi:MAG: N-acetylglucosamine-6-phosphate deacetylase, partial [Cyanobacteriota bacterium]
MVPTPPPAAVRWLRNVRLPEPEPAGPGSGRRWRVGLDDNNHIAAVAPIPAGSHASGEDWRGDWLSPAGVDLQINGGLGLAFPELVPDDLPRLRELLALLWDDGVEAICPTLVT